MKREILLAVIDTPGWQPPDDEPQTNAALEELRDEGWIIARLDGWEATTKALDEYPVFASQPDIADLQANGTAEHPEEDAHRACLPRGRVITIVAGMLTELPIVSVVKIASGEAMVGDDDPTVWRLAEDIVRQLV